MRRRLQPGLRTRVTLLAVIVVGVVLTGTAIALIAFQRSQLTQRTDDRLRRDAAVLEAAILSSDVEDLLGGMDGPADAAQLIAPDGAVVASSPNLAGDPPIADGTPGFRTVETLPIDDDVYRVLTSTVESPSGPLVVHVATSLDEVVEAVGFLNLGLLIAVPVVTTLLGGTIWWLVGRTLHPVEAIRREVDDIGGRSLDRRVTEPPGDDEITRLARTMNNMLGRVETAHRRQQSFVADASHELRTPLARMRAQLEVDLADDSYTVVDSLLDETESLGRLVDDLLHLAASDAGEQRTSSHLVDLDDLVFKEAKALEAQTTLKVNTREVSAALVRGDAGHLARAVRNLLDNAAHHATTTVVVRLESDDSRATLVVEDDGPGVPAHQGDAIFERFTRLDAARSRSTGGAGLGLAITRDIVERHGGTVRLDSAFASGARFIVELPAQP